MISVRKVKRERRLQEAKEILKMLLPMMIGEGWGYVGDQLTLMILGQYDGQTEHIAAVALGRSYFSMTGLAIAGGASMGIAPLVAMNHGAGADHLNGWVFWQCTKALAVGYVISLVAAFSFTAVSLSMGQPADAIAPAQVYLLVEMTALPGIAVSTAMETVLASQGLVGATAGLRAFGASLNIVLTYVFLRFCNMGWWGLALADALGYTLHVPLVVMFIIRTGRQDIVYRCPRPQAGADEPEEQAGTSGKSLTFGAYLLTTIPLATAMFVEAVAGEIMTWFAGWTRHASTSIAAQAVLNNMAGLFNYILGHAGVCLTIRVGHLLGAKDFAGIATAIPVAVEITALMGAMCAAFMWLQGSDLVYIYTANAAVVNEVINARWGMVLCIPVFSAMSGLGGALRVAGQPFFVMAVNVGTTLTIGIAMMWLLAIQCGLGLVGNWVANAICMMVSGTLMGLKICSMKWASAIQG